MANKYKVYWASSAEDDLISIIEFIYTKNTIAAKNNYKKIKIKVSNLSTLPNRGRIVPELKDEGILQYRELIISPWRIIYRISDFNVYVLLIIDSRKNIEDILLQRLVRKA